MIKFIKDIRVKNKLRTNLLINIDILDFGNVIIKISKKEDNFYKMRKYRRFV